jgi:glycosyltransferase involved in cell wall biosynthesis
MKILHLISSIGFYGAENVVINLMRENEKLGIISYLMVFNNSKNSHLEIAEVAQKMNFKVTVIDCKGRFDLRTLMSIVTFAKKERITCIHSHGFKSNLYAVLAKLCVNVKIIATCHLWTGNNRFYDSIDKAIIAFFDKIIAVSSEIENELYRNHINKSKVTMIHNGIDVSVFDVHGSDSALKKELRINDGTVVIGTVGRLNHQKGHIFL